MPVHATPKERTDHKHWNEAIIVFIQRTTLCPSLILVVCVKRRALSDFQDHAPEDLACEVVVLKFRQLYDRHLWRQHGALTAGVGSWAPEPVSSQFPSPMLQCASARRRPEKRASGRTTAHDLTKTFLSHNPKQKLITQNPINPNPKPQKPQAGNPWP